MGCNSSKLDDEEAVRLCKDRKKFIKQAVEHQLRFTSGHLAYIQSLKRVSAALRDYIKDDNAPCEFLRNSFVTPPFTPVKKSALRFITISPKCFPEAPTIQSESKASVKISFYRPSGNPPISVEEVPQSPETFQIQSYSIQNYGMDGFFTMQPPSVNPLLHSDSPDRRPCVPPPPPQMNQWDFLWDPFSSLEYYGYPSRNSIGQPVVDEGTNGLRQVQEGEEIPDMKQETEPKEIDSTNGPQEEVRVEDVDEEDDKAGADASEKEANGVKLDSEGNIELSQAPQGQRVEIHHHETAVGEFNTKEETPGFTVYVNQRPTSMDEVIKDLETQFMIICDSAKEISTLLESNQAHHASASHELSPMKMLNPVALFRSDTLCPSPSKFLATSSSFRDEGYESSSDFSAESCRFSSEHQSTLDRLYTWEKRLYEEVRYGERMRLAYEKKCKQLKDQAVKREDPASLGKLRGVVSDLQTQIKVAIHSIESISKRIETLRDEELHSQVLQLIQGLARMWKVMLECHQMQKQTLDDAKLLFGGTSSRLKKARRHSALSTSATDPNQLSRSASKLEAELRNWRACFESWVTSQRSYANCLAGWLLRCMRCESDTSKLPFSPQHAAESAPPIFGLCIQWSRFMDSLDEGPVLDGLDIFSNAIGCIYAQHVREDSCSAQVGSGENDDMGLVVGQGAEEDEAIAPEKVADVAARMLCAGMSVAMNSLTEFGLCSAEGYAELVKQWQNVMWPAVSSNGEKDM